MLANSYANMNGDSSTSKNGNIDFYSYFFLLIEVSEVNMLKMSAPPSSVHITEKVKSEN